MNDIHPAANLFPDHPAEACSFLKIKSDNSIRFGYPHRANYCHHTQPISHVPLDEQEQICLTSGHVDCSIYNEEWKGSLPDNQPAVEKPSLKKTMPIKTITLLVAMTLILIGVFTLFKLSNVWIR
jgi:hypothetical protein